MLTTVTVTSSCHSSRVRPATSSVKACESKVVALEPWRHIASTHPSHQSESEDLLHRLQPAGTERKLTHCHCHLSERCLYRPGAPRGIGPPGMQRCLRLAAPRQTPPPRPPRLRQGDVTKNFPPKWDASVFPRRAGRSQLQQAFLSTTSRQYNPHFQHHTHLSRSDLPHSQNQTDKMGEITHETIKGMS